MRILVSITAMLLFFAAGCQTAKQVQETNSPEPDPTPPPAATPAPPPPVPSEAFHPELLPEDLEGKLGIRDYQFEREGRTARLSMVLENMQAEEPVNLEVAARFEDAEGNAVSQTSWTRVNLRPEARHPYVAETLDPRPVTGTILMRLVKQRAE